MPYEVRLSDDHAYKVNGASVPGVSEILRPLMRDAFANVAPERIERKRIIGKRVHSITEMIDDNDLDEDRLHPDFYGYVGAYRRFLSEHKVTWLIRERPLYNPVYNYCGMLDRNGIVDGRACVVDFKATAAISPVASVQVSAYGDTSRRNGFEWERLHVLQLKPDGNYVFTKAIEFDEHFACFVGLLAAKRWELKHNAGD